MACSILLLVLALTGCLRPANVEDTLPALPAATRAPTTEASPEPTEATIGEPEAQAFLIEIGAVVSNGIPAAGAGNIEIAQSADIYVFRVDTEQAVYFNAQGQTAPMRWTLTDTEGRVVFRDVSLTIQDDPGTFTLPPGAYVITVTGADATVSGRYQFEIEVR